MVATRHGVKMDAGKNLANGIFVRRNFQVMGGHE